MKKRIRKVISVLLSIIIIATLIPVGIVSVGATQNRYYNFNSGYSISGNGANDMVSIAATQLGLTGSQLGYSEQWCADFVSDCAILANQSDAIPAAGYCPTLRQNIINSGGWYVDRYSAQAGDIVFYGNNGADHVEIVYAASGGNVSTYGGNSGSAGNLYGRSVKQHPTQTQSIAYIVRPKYKDEPVNPPTNVWLGKNQVWYDIQDTIYLAPHADGADYYWFSVYKDGQQIISQAIYGEYCFSANQWGYGDYSAYITAANSVGGTDSEWVDFSVVGVPSYNSIYKSSYWYDITDTVSITVESVCAKGQVIGIDKEGVGRVVTESCDTTFSIAASQLGVGDYSAYFSIYNGSGGIDTERIAFSIVGSPSYSDVYASKTIYKTDDTVAITVDTVCAKGQVIGIDKEGVGRVVTENCDSTYYISASQLGVGKYSCYFSVYNGSGSIDTKRAFFEIVDEYSSANLGNDFYAYIKNVDSDKVLKNNNGNVELSAKSNNSNQIWRFIRNSDNTYTMLSFFDNKAMDVAGAESENGTNIQTYESNGSNAQHWYIIECKNGYVFIPKSSQNKVADLLYGHMEVGTNLQLYDYNGSSAQIFTVEKAAPINALISLNKK